jgi:hypothetical protein
MNSLAVRELQYPLRGHLRDDVASVLHCNPVSEANREKCK